MKLPRPPSMRTMLILTGVWAVALAIHQIFWGNEPVPLRFKAVGALLVLGMIWAMD